jgi:serine/threonine protein kinase
MLRHHRDKLHAPMDGATVKSVMWQLLNGLSYMEQNWLIHRDLKPSNILVMGDGEEQVRTSSQGIRSWFSSRAQPGHLCAITAS